MKSLEGRKEHFGRNTIRGLVSLTRAKPTGELAADQFDGR